MKCEPYRVDGDPVSSQAESLAADTERWRTLLAQPRWEVCWVDLTDKVKCAQALDESWEPFTVDAGKMWLRRMHYRAPAPLPPQ